jgi:hypothetical protein
LGAFHFSGDPDLTGLEAAFSSEIKPENKDGPYKEVFSRNLSGLCRSSETHPIYLFSAVPSGR